MLSDNSYLLGEWATGAALAASCFLVGCNALSSPVPAAIVQSEAKNTPITCQVGPGCGVPVANVTPGSAADKAGLMNGDLVLSAGGKPTNSKEDITAVFKAATSTHEVLSLVVSRQGEIWTIDVQF